MSERKIRSRTEYSMLNIAAGVGGYVLSVILSLISRMIFTRCLPPAYLGISGLFSNVLSMLSLAELGVGGAIVYALYKPLAENNEEKIASLVRLFGKAYCTIGLVMGAAGLCVLPFLNLVIGEQPEIAESIHLIYLIYLFFVVYPGNVTSDSIWQLNQIVRDAHTNHHPYWHTMSIKYSMALGYAIFHDVNAAAATYSVFQSMIMAACFAYSVVTLYQYRIPKLWVFLVYAGFAVLPCHISYSATVWKDVPFGAAVLLLVVAMFRIIRGVGNSRISNYVMFAIGGIGTGIMRTNGWYALVAAFAVLLIFFHKRCRKLLLPWFAVVLVGWILTNPVLDHLGVDRVNFIEGLSVPLQQVARVIVTGGELTEEEVQKIDTILDIDKVPDAYWDKCVDEIKDLIRAKNYPYLQEHKDEYLDLWLDIGKRYPWDYVEAWVEQTKGYWNGGYARTLTGYAARLLNMLV